MLESLSELPACSISSLSEALSLKPYVVDAKSFTWVRRPRFFWITWDIKPLPGESIVDRGLYFEWSLLRERGARDAWVDSGCCWQGSSFDLLPVFTRRRPRSTAPSTTVDLNTLPPDVVMRWHEDRHRFDVFCYLPQHMVTTSEGVLRLPTLKERERLMGFPDNYFSAGLHPKLKGADREAVGAQLIGGTLCVFSVMVVLDSLLALFAGNAARQQSAFFERGSAQHVGLMHWSLSSMQDTVTKWLAWCRIS